MSGDYLVKPVYKSLQVLQCLGESPGGLTLTEIYYRVGLPKTTVFRYLYTLQTCGFVAHDPETDLYSLGLQMWKLGQVAGARLHVRQAALPVMYELRDRFNETINLGMIDGSEVVYLDMVESRRSLRMLATPGGRDPIYSTALGKAMLAHLPEEQWSNHLPTRLEPRTSRTLTSLGVLRQDLVETRLRGFALDQGENEEGACCIGTPIFDETGRVIAAISLSAPASRLTPRLQQEVASALMNAAATVSFRLGYRASAGNDGG